LHIIQISVIFEDYKQKYKKVKRKKICKKHKNPGSTVGYCWLSEFKSNTNKLFRIKVTTQLRIMLLLSINKVHVTNIKSG